jgi:hypothetical protein
MSPTWILDQLLKEWPVIKQAPLTLVVIFLLAFGLAYLFCRWLYQDAIKRKDDLIADLGKKLKGLDALVGFGDAKQLRDETVGRVRENKKAAPSGPTDEAPPASPANLRFLKPKVIPVFQNRDNGFRERLSDNQVVPDKPEAAIIPLINEMPESGVASSIQYLRATLALFRHDDDDEGLRIPEPIWLGRVKPHISLDGDQIEKLIIAVRYANGVANVMKFGQEKHETYEDVYVFDPGYERLHEDRYRVQVQIIKGYKDAERLLMGEFILTLKPEFSISAAVEIG